MFALCKSSSIELIDEKHFAATIASHTQQKVKYLFANSRIVVEVLDSLRLLCG